MEGMTRAFIAVEIPENVRKEMAKLAAEIECGSARPVKESQMHITLLFLGNLDDQGLREVVDVVSKVKYQEFEVTMNGIGTFSRRNPTVIFANVTEGTEALNEIYSMIKEGLERINIKIDEKNLSPHATIARVHRPTPNDVSYIDGFVASHSEDSLGSFRCSEIKLKRSVLAQAGAEYTDIVSIKLNL